MVQDYDLKTPLRGKNLLTKQPEDLTHSGNIFVSPFRSLSFFVRAFGTSLWKIHLARLVKYEKSRNCMINIAQKEFLQRNHESNVIGEPIRAAADLPQIVVAAPPNDLHG